MKRNLRYFRIIWDSEGYIGQLGKFTLVWNVLMGFIFTAGRFWELTGLELTASEILFSATESSVRNLSYRKSFKCDHFGIVVLSAIVCSRKVTVDAGRLSEHKRINIRSQFVVAISYIFKFETHELIFLCHNSMDLAHSLTTVGNSKSLQISAVTRPLFFWKRLNSLSQEIIN